MLARTKRAKTKILYFLPLVLVGAILVAGFLFPNFNIFAAAGHMTAKITDDSDEIDFSPGIDDAVANFSYKKVGTEGTDSKIYDAKVTLRNLPDNSDKQLNITLPVGMSWVDDASKDEYLRSQLDASKGTNGVKKIALTDAPVLGYSYPNSGTREYYFQRGTRAVTVSVKVKADSTIDTDYIEDAIVAKLYINNIEAESAHVDVSVPSGVNKPGRFYLSSNRMYVNAGTTYQTDQGYYRLIRASYVNGYFDVRRTVRQIIVSITVDDPAAKIVNVGGAAWELDDSEGSEGRYTLTYNSTTPSNVSISLPYAVEIPDNAEGGKVYTVKLAAKTVVAQPNGAEDHIIDFSNSQTLYFQVLPSDSLVSVGLSSLSTSNPATAVNTNYSTSVYAQPDVQGELGRFYINNRGSTASNPLRAKITFDTTVLGVMNLELACEPGSTVESIHIKTDSGVDKDVEVNKTCSTYGYTGNIPYTALGLERFDYIKEVEYDIGSIPAGFQLAHSAHDSIGIAYTGRLLTNETPGVATIEVFEIDDPSKTTGVSKTTTTFSSGRGTLDITNHATKVINAGQPLNFSINVKNWAGGTNYDNTVLSPILYIRQEVKDAEGNYLPISNLKVVTDSIRGNQDITSLFGEISCVDTDTARVYILDGRNVPDGRASLSGTYTGEDGRTGESTITVSWTVETSFTTPDQQYPISTMFFAQDPNHGGSITTHYMRGDPYGISIVPNTNSMIYAATTNYYQVRGWNAISVENTGKHASSDDWISWSEGAEPITIGVAEGSFADMQVSMSNNSGVDVPGPTTIYLPIPKTGQNWGMLSLDDEDFAFSVALDSPISNPNSESFTISYGRNVTPTDDGATIESQLDKFTTDTSGWTEQDWKEVNCIQIVAHDIAANEPGTVDTYDFVYRLKVVDATDIVDGVTDTWRPLYFQQLTNSAGDIFAGWYKGSYVAIKLADGKVSGRLFVDKNENGKKDSNEDYLSEAGWKVNLYDASSNRLVRTTTTGEDGSYSFIELSVNSEGYYAVVENKYPIDSDSDTRYLFSKKGDQSAPGEYNSDNQAEGSKTTTPAHLTGYIGAISPSKTVGEATYNVGLIEYVDGEQYTGEISFDDQDNSYSTRPNTVQLTATGSDGDVRTFDVAPGQPYALDLPRYNNSGVRVSYIISAADYAGYDKTEDTDASARKYNFAYDLESYVFTVNHIRSDTGNKIAESTEETVYYGQPYESSPLPESEKYRVSSVDGSESGRVSDDVVVSYYYDVYRGTVTVHYYLENTTISVADDENADYEVDAEYETSPIVLGDDYILVTPSPANAKGIVDAPNIEVIYYYRAKTQPDSPITFDSIVFYSGMFVTLSATAWFIARRARHRI